MDEKYIQDLYNQLGGQSKFGNFNDFKNLINTDKQYQKDFYNSFGAKKLGEFNDFSGLVSVSNQKKKESSQPTSQPKQSVSSTQQKEQLISAVTGQQQNQQASATSDGEPKIGTFTGFTPEQQKSMQAKPAPDYMVKKPREKEIEKQTEVSKGELLIQSPPLGQETKSYYRVVADEKRDVENKIKNFEDKYLKDGIDIEQIKTDGTYQDLQKQKAQLDEEYRPVENALREVKKETTTFTRPIERLVSSFTDGKYTLANTETINLSKDVEDKLIDSFDKLPQEQKQKWAKGSLPTEAKEQLINTAKTEVLNEKYTSLKAEFSDYIKNVKDNPNISTEQKKLIQDQLKAKNDAFNAQVAIDFSGNTLKNNFKSTKQSKDLDEGILSKYEGFIPETLDAASTFIEGMGSVIAKGATGIPTLALLGAERFNQITGASNPDDYTPIEATLDLINDTTNYNFLPSSKSAEGNIVDEEGNLNLSYRSVTKTLANTLPFTLKIINDVKKGRIEGSPQSMISQLLNPKNNKQFRDQLIAAETAYKITIGDNYKQAKDLGMTDANAFTYANVMSMAEGVSESIMPDIKFFDTVAGSSIKEAFKGNLKNAATKEAAKTVTKDFFKNIGGELGEEEFTLAVEDGLKYSMLLNHKNSEFFNLTKQKELAASTIILSGALGGVAIPNKLKESKKDIYTGVYNNIADIQDLFATEIKSPLTDKKTKESLYEAYKFASDVANAVAKAPETVTADQIDLLVQKNKLEEKKRNTDTAFHPDINKEIADIDAKIAEASKAKVEPVVEEIKTTQPVVTAETSSNFANMTQDGEGNFVFYHVSPTTLDVIDPSKYGSNAGNVTSRDEKAAIGRVGGVAMFYTDPTDSENMVNGNKHVVKVPESEVYDFNSDPNNFYDEAKRQFSEANPNMAFSPNDQFAWITKVAGDNGYKMVVGEWGNGKTRAQTTQKLTPVDVMEVSGNTVTKPFEKEYIGNREKGFKAVIPQSKQSKIREAKAAIDSFRSRAGKYDELYQAVNGSRPNMTDEEIKKLVDESDIPQELKDQYSEAIAYEPGKRRTEAPKGDVGRRIEEIKADPENEFGETFDPNGKVYDVKDQDDIVTLASENVKPEDLNEDRINQFKEKYKDIIDNVKDAKVGVFRLANGDYSIDLNTVVDSKYRENTLKFARDNNQESIYNGKEGEIKTGGNGDTVLKDKQDLIDAANKIANGESYEIKTKTTEIDAELEALNKLFDESEQGGKVTDTQIENGKKAIENLVPDVEWVIHDTNESMTAATGSPDKGAYIMTKDKDGNVKKVIHINKASADGTTVAHEVFHAVLLEKVLNDADAQDLTRRMMKAVAKTASPELKRQLDEFARNYEENIRDEEKLAQLIGILAKNYDQLSQPNKTIIKKWLDKLAKMFGLKPFTDNEVIDLLNTIAGKTAIGDVITEKDVDILNSGVSTYISEPVEIKKFQSKNEKKVKVGDHKLSFVKKSDIIDLNSLMKDISDKKQKVWFWVADQLGRGNYYDEVIDGEHYLDAGPSFALDPVNRDKNIIWATGKNEKEITKLIGNSDYIFIISGSPLKSKLFNKRIIDIVSKRAGDFDVFKKEVLDSSKIKSLNDILSSVNSWNELRDSTKRKEFLLELSNQQQKNTPLKKVLEKYNAIVDLNELRDGFYADNNFDLNDIMLVLKPTEYGGKSDHSTYENNILGDVVGVPDIKVNAFDIMPSELKDKYKEVLSKSQQQQAVAPYGIGVRTIERKQKSDDTNKTEKVISVYHGAPKGKDVTKISDKGVKFFATDKREADEYARMNSGVTQEFLINDSDLVNEDVVIEKIKELGLTPKNKEFEVDDASFYELIDVRFDESLSKEDITKLFDALKKDGIKAIRYTDGAQVSGNLTTSIAVINSSIISTPIISKETKRSQVGSNTIADYVRIAKANNFSDEAIKKFLKSKGFSDSEIDTAMSARITSTGRPSVNNIYNQSKKAIEDRKKRASIKDLLPYLRKSLLDRQSYIKRLINKIDNKSAKKAYDLLVTKAGASALASERFKRAEKEIYGGLSSDDVNILDKMIYAKRIIAVNENRAKLGMEPYTGMDGYSVDDARQDLSDFKELLGADKYNDLSNRATSYFDVFKTNLKKLYDSGRISKEVYDSLKDTEYSPIKTIKYIIGDNLTIDEIDTQAKSLGISRKDIMKLSDSNENEIILDSKWLLAMNISSVEGRAFENNMLREFDRAINDATPEEKKALEDFVLENPVVGTKKDGSPKYKYDDAKLPVGYVKVSYFDNGNKREIVIKDEYAKQLLDVKNKNKALETLGALTGTKILRFFATGGNPLFIIGNTAVDFQNIAFFSDVYSKFKPLATVQLIRDYTKNFIKKIVVSNQYNKVFNEYINHGGALDYMASDGLRALESMNPIKGATKAAQKGLIAYGRAMAFLGETSEVAFRLSVYDKVKNDSIKEFKKENNREPNAQELDDIMWKAARESRETMDFSQGGDVAKNIDAVFPYFNAALQGIRRPIDFAKKDPVGFSSSVLQYTAMAASLAAGSFAMLIKAVRDDEDEDKEANKKILEALNSLSEYEKANYHVIFTGNKDKDGEYEYYRVKKLPVLSVISTVAEQLIYKQFFNSQGVDYDVDSEAMMEAVSKSNPLPVTVQEVAAKNPVASGLVSYWANKDTFTGEKIFREPNNKKIMPEAEGMFDDRVDQIYKDLAPGFGLSPARTKVMVEKVITSGNTNPTIPLIYSAYDGIFNNNDGLGEEVQAAMSSVGDAFGKKLVRYTDKNVIRYKEQDKMEFQETVMETDIWKSEQKVYNEIKKIYKDGDKLTNKELFDIVEKNFDPMYRTKYVKKYNAYIHNMNIDKSVLDIIFEDVPEVQAMKLNQRYGDNLEGDELKELNKAANSAGKRVSNKSIYIYNKKYKNRKD